MRAPAVYPGSSIGPVGDAVAFAATSIFRSVRSARRVDPTRLRRVETDARDRRRIAASDLAVARRDRRQPRGAHPSAQGRRNLTGMKQDAIWNCARADLLVATSHGDPDVFLWEHSVRVAQNAARIARLPDVASHRVDQTALLAAALYHDAVWVIGFREGRVDRKDILLSPPPDFAWGQAAAWMETRLASVLTPGSLRRAASAIRDLGAREAESIEGRILTEANNLDEFGLPALWPAIRRGLIEGKGVQAVIDTWRRKKEYQFWGARVRDSFRFPSVRKLAERRLRRVERIMAELERHHQGLDIVEAASPSPRRPATKKKTK